MKKKRRIRVKSYKRKNGTPVKSHIRNLKTSKSKKKKKPRLKKRTLSRRLVHALKELAKEDFEWAVALDFEDLSKNPYKLERIITELGNGEYVWMIEGSDYEVHIHTHSNNPIAYPSDADLYALEYGQPQIIISDFKHYDLYDIPRQDICIYSIEDLDKFNKKKKKWATNLHNEITKKTINEIKKRYPTAIIIPEYDEKEKLVTPRLFNLPIGSELGKNLRKDYYSILRESLIEGLKEYGINLKVFAYPYELKTKTDYQKE
jgi:hypothetical protein